MQAWLRAGRLLLAGPAWALLAGTAWALLAGPAWADLPPPDPAHTITVQIENDKFAHTDRDYTSGLRLGWTSPNVNAAGAPYLPDFLNRMGTALWGEGRQRLSIDVSSAIFTPKDTAVKNPDPRDRAYAGVILASAFLLHDTTHTRSLIGLGLGVLGPSARGEDIQNGFHDLIGESESGGWSHQVKDMPIVQIFGGRTWRYGLTPNPGVGIEVDMLPSVSAGVGTLRDYAQAGLQFRVGQGLDSDFGTTRIKPGLSGSDAYTPSRDFVWYVFGGLAGQAVGWDATLDGNPFQSGRHVTRTPFVAEFEGGVAVIYRGVRLTYTHVVQTRQFQTQAGGLFQFGSVAASVRF